MPARKPLTTHLFLDEYIDKELYLKYTGREHILVGLLDSRLIAADQKLREVFGPVIINTWWDGGSRNWSGLRRPESPDYSYTSQHSFGRASDKIFKQATADEVREYIKVHWRALGITCIEADVTWVHSDVRAYRKDELLIKKP